MVTPCKSRTRDSNIALGKKASPIRRSESSLSKKHVEVEGGWEERQGFLPYPLSQKKEGRGMPVKKKKVKNFQSTRETILFLGKANRDGGRDHNRSGGKVTNYPEGS